MRLDKYLTAAGVASRRECAALIKKGLVQVNDLPAKKGDMQIDPETDRVTARGSVVDYRENRYLIMNKPEGYVSSTDDPGAPTVLSLLPDAYKRFPFFPCGRLDRNTTGLILLTTDGPLAHRLLAPKSHVSKSYRFTVKFPISREDVERLEAGVVIEGGYTTMPCKVKMEGERAGVITICEGKYHQIKLMMQAVHNQITSLCRISFGPLTLDEDLKSGSVRELSERELELLLEAGRGGSAECEKITPNV